MLLQKCQNCGLFDKNQNGQRYCIALKRNLKEEDLYRHWVCYYFIATIIEDGEQLTPFEHYLLMMDDFEKKKVSVINIALN